MRMLSLATLTYPACQVSLHPKNQTWKSIALSELVLTILSSYYMTKIRSPFTPHNDFVEHVEQVEHIKNFPRERNCTSQWFSEPGQFTLSQLLSWWPAVYTSIFLILASDQNLLSFFFFLVFPPRNCGRGKRAVYCWMGVLGTAA